VPECSTCVLFSLDRAGKVRLAIGDVHAFRRTSDMSPLVEVDARGETADFYSKEERACGLAVEKAVLRLLRNLEVDLADCSCVPADPCPAHELIAALKLAGKTKRSAPPMRVRRRGPGGR